MPSAELVLTEAARASLRERVLRLPPLTDEQIDAIAEVVVSIRRKPLQETPTAPAETPTASSGGAA